MFLQMQYGIRNKKTGHAMCPVDKEGRWSKRRILATTEQVHSMCHKKPM
jgi:hypothetical protein